MRLPALRWDPAADELDWQPSPSPGVSYVVLHLRRDPTRERIEGRTVGGSILIKMEPGSGYAPHRHLGEEEVWVLQGGYRDEQGEHVAGDHVVYPSQSVHTPLALGVAGRDLDCILLTSAPEGIEVLGDPG